MDEFDTEIKTEFLEEVTQLLVDAEQCFLDLEENSEDIATVDKIFRIAHNIKGGSRAVGFEALGVFTHEVESFMLKCKSGQIPILPSTISLLLKCNDHVRSWVSALKNDFSAVLDNQPMIEEIHRFQAGATSNESFPSEKSFDESDFSVEAGDFSMGHQAPKQDTDTFPPVKSVDEYPQMEYALNESLRVASEKSGPSSSSIGLKSTTDESIRVSLARLEGLLNFVGEMVILQTVLREHAYGSNAQVLRRTIHQMGKVTKEVQDISMSLRMVPLKQTFQKMQRIVRDISSSLGKKVQLLLEGEETEVDKTILEALSDPLIHLIRNAVDHGIEDPASRVQKGKSEMGQIILRAYHQSGNLVIEVKDNGSGISSERLKQKAIEKGILKQDQVLSDREAINLIFHSGFSTKNQVTEVSGRGVGMDVVKTNIEQIQGKILVETELDKGSTFKIILPLTLAIIDGMVVHCCEERYVIPLSHVHETMKLDPKDIQFLTGLGETLILRGENLPVVRLSQTLGKKKRSKIETEQIAIIIRTHGQPFALLVDDIIGQHQIVIKKLGAEMRNIRGYSGSAILGDGRPALILEIRDLVISQNYSLLKGREAAI